MMFKIATVTLAALIPALSAMTFLNLPSPSAVTAAAIEARMNAAAHNLAHSAPPSRLLLNHCYFRTGQFVVFSDSNQEPTSSPLTSPDKLVLSQKQIDIILANQTPLNLDFKRTGAEFTDFEREIGIALTKIAPNCMESMMNVLGFVFSQERAQAILNAIIEDV
jgi:hypothetical protein